MVVLIVGHITRYNADNIFKWLSDEQTMAFSTTERYYGEAKEIVIAGRI